MDESLQDAGALVLAFEHAAGRGAPGAAPTLERFAAEVLAVGRRVMALPACPGALLRKAATLVDVSPRRSPRSAAAAVWKLVFDSWSSAMPATRGSTRSRFLRFGGPGGSLDVEMVTGETGNVRLRGTLDGPTGDLDISISRSGGRALRVPVRAGGFFSASLAAPAAPFTLTVCAGRRPILRTGRMPPPVSR